MSLTQAKSQPGTQTPVRATLQAVEATRFSDKSGKPFQQTTLWDGQVSEKVKIWQGNGPALTTQHVGQTLDFAIKGYTSSFDNKVYLSGFWQSQAQTQQAPPPGPTYEPVGQAPLPTPAQQQAYAAAAQPLPPPPTGPSENAMQIFRQCAAKVASWLAAGEVIDPMDRFAEADKWVAYFINGRREQFESEDLPPGMPITLNENETDENGKPLPF